MGAICADLAAEHAVLDGLVAGLDEQGWSTPTAAAGWDVKDTVFHIAFFDEAGRLAAVDPAGFEAQKAEMFSGRLDPEDSSAMTGAELLAWWRNGRAVMLEAAGKLEPKARLPWYGPPMSALSFFTARLMETWSHGLDVADAVGAPVEPTDRLKHVAHMGWVTRGWSYVNRAMAPNDTPVRVELTAPSGEVWTWGPDDAEEHISGPALDFCLVVTQRRPVGAVSLTIVGDAAAGWMSIAQAFAGGPTITDERRAAAGTGKGDQS